MIGHVVMDIGLFACGWTGIARRLYRADEAHTGADRPFVIGCAALTISLLTVLVAISRLRGRARIADDRSGE
jgi:hypothetical protein